MFQWLLSLSLIFLSSQALAAVSLRLEGTFPNQKVFLTGDVNPQAPETLIYVIVAGEVSTQPTHILQPPANGAKTWTQELQFTKGYGFYGIHVFNRHDAYQTPIKIAQLQYVKGTQISSSRSRSGSEVVSGVAKAGVRITRVQVFREGRSERDTYDFLNDGKPWRKRVHFRHGPGKYTVAIFEGSSADIEQTEYRFSSRFEIENLATLKHSLDPSAVVQNDHPQIQLLAQQIVGNTKDPMTMARLVHDWVASNISYDFELYRRTIERPRSIFMTDSLTTLENRKSICDGYSNLSAALLRSLGVPTRIIYGMTAMGRHAWNEFYANNQWFSMDVTWDAGTLDPAADQGRGLFTPGLRHLYFAPSATEFDKDHSNPTVTTN